MTTDDKRAKTKPFSSKHLWYLAVGHTATACGERVRPSKGTCAFVRHHSVKQESPSSVRSVGRRLSNMHLYTFNLIMTEILSANSEIGFKKAVDLLKNGDVVVFPTDTTFRKQPLK